MKSDSGRGDFETLISDRPCVESANLLDLLRFSRFEIKLKRLVVVFSYIIEVYRTIYGRTKQCYTLPHKFPNGLFAVKLNELICAI